MLAINPTSQPGESTAVTPKSIYQPFNLKRKQFSHPINVKVLNTVKESLRFTLDGAIFHKSLRCVLKHSAV